jgi:hypothetical protein
LGDQNVLARMMRVHVLHLAAEQQTCGSWKLAIPPEVGDERSARHRERQRSFHRFP